MQMTNEKLTLQTYNTPDPLLLLLHAPKLASELARIPATLCKKCLYRCARRILTPVQSPVRTNGIPERRNAKEKGQEWEGALGMWRRKAKRRQQKAGGKAEGRHRGPGGHYEVLARPGPWGRIPLRPLATYLLRRHE